MIIARMQGGLGNQLFQYAFALQLARMSGKNLKLDISFFQHPDKTPKVTQRDFHLSSLFPNIEYADTQLLKEIQPQGLVLKGCQMMARIGVRIHPSYLFEKKQFCFQEIRPVSRSITYLDGYWQHRKYAENAERLLRNSINLGVPVYLQHYIPTNKQCIALHVRRGDYVKNPRHPTLEANYYEEALETLGSKISTLQQLLIFSDDIEWCVKQLPLAKFSKNVVYVEEGSDIDQFKLMAACNHFILANSTFSWWAAFLSQSPEKQIIAPATWINYRSFNPESLFPPTWLIR